MGRGNGNPVPTGRDRGCCKEDVMGRGAGNLVTVELGRGCWKDETCYVNLAAGAIDHISCGVIE